MPYINIEAAEVRAGRNNLDRQVGKAAKQVEEVFLNELLKSMFQNTELGKDKVISNYLPIFTAEISKSLSKRGIGIQEFFMKSAAFSSMVEKGQDNGKPASLEWQDIMPSQSINIRAYEVTAE